MAENDDVLKQMRAWLGEGRGVALATVVGTWGSSPRPPGSLLAVAEDGAFMGSVSGGCIEGAVVAEAAEVIAEGGPRLLDFGVTDEQAWEVGLACGGTMKVLVQPAPDAATVDRLVNDRPVALVTDLGNGARALVTRDGVGGALALDGERVAAARHALAENRAATIAGDELFVGVYNPPLRMIIVGAVHIAQALAPMAALVGFAVTVVDPRGAFATEARFPGVARNLDWPDTALADMAPDSRTAVITLTHDPKLDDPALAAALGSDCFYIGALGSRRTHAKRLARLAAMGIGDDAVGRIHAPIGLALGGRETAEIAVAVLAQVVAANHGALRRAD